MTFSDLGLARDALKIHGGFLYCLGGGVYEVTDDHPCERRSFTTNREAMDYAFRLAEAGYDESAMPIYED